MSAPGSGAICQAGLLIGALVAVGTYATRWEPYHPRLRYRDVLVPAHWPELNVLHVSDLHVRRGAERMLKAQRQILSGLRATPDLVCATGDLCEQPGDAELAADVLSLIEPRLGIYAVLGNHEYDAPPPAALRRSFGSVLWHSFKIVLPRAAHSRGSVDADAISTSLRDRGIHVLRNQGVRLQPGDSSIWLCGSDSMWAGRADVAGALRGRGRREAVLALVHEPELAFAAVEHGADLVLAGHTHGGQVRIPPIGPLYYHRCNDRLRVASGFQRVDHGILHITTGLGQLLQLRFLCPPEVVWLHCVPSRNLD